MKKNNLNRVEINTKNGQLFYLVNPNVSDEAVCKHSECIFNSICPDEITDIDNVIRNQAINKSLIPLTPNTTLSITSEKGTNVYIMKCGNGNFKPLKQIINKSLEILDEIETIL